MWGLPLLFGVIVGLSLGMTGGGGAMFAVPLLVYGLGIPAKEAVGISLAAVGATSFAGFLHRWHLGQVELATGFVFAVAGMLGAPLGTWLATFVPDSALLLAFAGLMVIVAVRLWQQSSRPAATKLECPVSPDRDKSACHRDQRGRLILSSRCAWLLIVIGSLTGVFSGLFGVGGGFVIVPALVLFSGMPIHRAVGTSLMVIALVSVSGITSQVWAGRTIPADITGFFILGGTVGLFIGQQIGHRLSGPVLQKVFVIAIFAVAAFVVLQNFHS